MQRSIGQPIPTAQKLPHVNVESFRGVNRMTDYVPNRNTECKQVGIGAYHNAMRYKAQSILFGLVDSPELPDMNQALDILAWADMSCLPRKRA